MTRPLKDYTCKECGVSFTARQKYTGLCPRCRKQKYYNDNFKSLENERKEQAKIITVTCHFPSCKRKIKIDPERSHPQMSYCPYCKEVRKRTFQRFAFEEYWKKMSVPYGSKAKPKGMSHIDYLILGG